MARMSTAAKSFGGTSAAASVLPASEPTSGVHARIAPKSAALSFSAWVNGLLSSAPRAHIEALEERLLAALQARDVAASLMVACSIVYLDPEHSVALRIKRRCAREMQRALARGEGVPRMALRWSALRERGLSPQAVSVLSCIDGRSSVDEVIGLTGLPPAVARETFAALVRDGIVVTEVEAPF